jgi:SAM-dependent methyltransferase
MQDHRGAGAPSLELQAPCDPRSVSHRRSHACRHIARKLGCTAEGFTLSPVQAERANEISAKGGLGDRCHYQVADALAQPFEDDTFDLVWSLESGEHMPDKRKFVGELLRVAAPGGRVAIVTWCHRNLQPGEKALAPEEQAVLDRVNEAYYLPQWCSLADYEALFGAFWRTLTGKSCCESHSLQRMCGLGWPAC